MCGEQLKVFDQLIQAIRVSCDGAIGQEYVQVEIFEGGLDLKLARIAVVLALQDLKHLLIRHSLSMFVQ